jgi:hypothetical protein
MKVNRAVLTAIVIVVVLIAGWWLFRGGRGAGHISLIDRFGEAMEKKPNPEVFSIVDANLAGVTKKAIAMQPTAGTRIKWKVKVPDDGWLWVSVGMQPEAWTKEGDGLKFLVGISDGRTSEELFAQHVNPFANQGDRKWIDVRVDLSTYAGEDVELFFNTYGSLPGHPADVRNDLGLWGNPEIVVR